MAPRVTTDQILEATLAAVRRVGIQKLTMVDIATEAGISRHTLYRRLRTKDEVLVAVGEYLVRSLHDALQGAVEADPDPERRIQVVVSSTFQIAHDEPFGQLLELEPRFYRRFAQRHFEEWVDSVAGTLSWPVELSAMPRSEHLRRAAELILRHSLSFKIIAPRDWNREIEVLVGAAEGFLAPVWPLEIHQSVA
jgi:AcrR family transcriptional regulator